MNFNQEDTDRLLMSDSLRGNVPELEEQIKFIQDSVIVVGIDYVASESKDVIAGSVVGISFEGKDVKLDFRKNTSDAYKFLKLCIFDPNASCNSLYLQNNEDEIILQGPYKISSPKITDLDHKEKACTIGLDLIKYDP